VDKGDKMANSYSISHQTLKWMKKLFFHLLNLAILNSYILNSSCEGKKISHRFSIYPHEEYVGTVGTKQIIWRKLSTLPNVESHIARLKACSSTHWPILSETQLRCHVCNARAVTQKFSSAISVKWDCVIKEHVLKTTTLRYSSNNIRCNLVKKNWGLKPICK